MCWNVNMIWAIVWCLIVCYRGIEKKMLNVSNIGSYNMKQEISYIIIVGFNSKQPFTELAFTVL